MYIEVCGITNQWFFKAFITVCLTSIVALQVISPATKIFPLVAITSHATREYLSFERQASKIVSEI